MSNKLKWSIISLVIVVLLVAGGVTAGVLIKDKYDSEPMATVTITGGLYGNGNTLQKSFEEREIVFGRKDIDEKQTEYNVNEQITDERGYVKLCYAVSNDSNETYDILVSISENKNDSDNFVVYYSLNEDVTSADWQEIEQNKLLTNVESKKTTTIYFYIQMMANFDSNYNATLTLEISSQGRN